MKANSIERAVVISSAEVGNSWEAVGKDMRDVIQGSSVGKIFRDLGNRDLGNRDFGNMEQVFFK